MYDHIISAFCIGFSTAYFINLAVMAFRKKKRTRLQTLLGCIFVVWALFDFKDIFYVFPNGYVTENLRYVIFFDGWMAVCYAAFIFELTMPGWVTLKRLALMLLPFVLFTAAYVAYPHRLTLLLYIAFLVVFALTIIYVGYVKAKRYIEYERNNYSDIEHIDISWIRPVFVFCIIGQLMWLAVSVTYSILFDIIYSLIVIMMWQMVLRYSYNTRPIHIEDADTAAYDGGAVRQYPFAGYLESMIVERELYLDSNLSIPDLVDILKTNRTYISEYFRDVLHTSFYDYINGLRITRKSMPMLVEHPEYTLEYIAVQSGFNNIATFRRAFRRHAGCGPKEYREKISTSPDACVPLLPPSSGQGDAAL